jgi:hypothetical protein
MAKFLPFPDWDFFLGWLKMGYWLLGARNAKYVYVWIWLSLQGDSVP